jgi:hypothetical protein
MSAQRSCLPHGHGCPTVMAAQWSWLPHGHVCPTVMAAPRSWLPKRSWSQFPAVGPHCHAARPGCKALPRGQGSAAGGTAGRARRSCCAGFRASGTGHAAHPSAVPVPSHRARPPAAPAPAAQRSAPGRDRAAAAVGPSHSPPASAVGRGASRAAAPPGHRARTIEHGNLREPKPCTLP